MKKRLMLLGALALLMLPGAALSAQTAGWVHVRVDGDEDEQVQLNLPVSMVSVAFQAIREEGLEDLRGGRGGSDDDVSFDDARALWQAMRDAGDAEFVNVQDGDDSLRIYREGDRVYVEGSENGDQSLSIEMPVQLADALLGEDADDVDFEAVIQDLVRQGQADLVLIRDDERTVRLWADNRSTQD
jgi:hypothetical protein